MIWGRKKNPTRKWNLISSICMSSSWVSGTTVGLKCGALQQACDKLWSKKQNKTSPSHGGFWKGLYSQKIAVEANFIEKDSASPVVHVEMLQPQETDKTLPLSAALILNDVVNFGSSWVCCRCLKLAVHWEFSVWMPYFRLYKRRRLTAGSQIA